MSEDNSVKVEYIENQPASVFVISDAADYSKVKLMSTQNISIEADVEADAVKALKLCQRNTLYKITSPDFSNDVRKGIAQKI